MAGVRAESTARRRGPDARGLGSSTPSLPTGSARPTEQNAPFVPSARPLKEPQGLGAGWPLLHPFVSS